MVSSHLNNISQIGSFPQVGVKIKNIWNHHLDSVQNHILSRYHHVISVDSWVFPHQKWPSDLILTLAWKRFGKDMNFNVATKTSSNDLFNSNVYSAKNVYGMFIFIVFSYIPTSLSIDSYPLVVEAPGKENHDGHFVVPVTMHLIGVKGSRGIVEILQVVEEVFHWGFLSQPWGCMTRRFKVGIWLKQL